MKRMSSLFLNQISRSTNVTAKRFSSDLKTVLNGKITSEREKVSSFLKKHGSNYVCDVTVNTVFKGMRGASLMIWEPSLLDPNEGIRFRGYSINEVAQKLPKAKDGEQPLPEGMFWLLMTGELPTEKQTHDLSRLWAEKSHIPDYVKKMIQNFPKNLHPMTQFSIAVGALGVNSRFTKAYHDGVPKAKYWEYTFDDAMDLTARIPGIGALIYNNTFKDKKDIPDPDPNRDWADNFMQMLEVPKTKESIECMRLYLTLHSDHEGGNVSAHATHLVNSALTDPYLSYSAGLAGLAGPLHGLANQECLIWLMKLHKNVGDNASDDQVRSFIQNTLKSGQVVPGFGHAVLRKTDPRYTALADFGHKHLGNDELVKLAAQVYKIAPEVLKATGKVQNPWPNVDGHSGVLLMAYGLTEMTFYTVLFGISRCLGVMAGITWARALGLPIERPKSVTSDSIMEMLSKKS